MKVFQTVLFLRTGNFYRSRYAEAQFNYQAAGSGLHWRAESKGFRPHLATEDLSHWAADRRDRSGIALSLTSTKPAKVTVEDLPASPLVIAVSEKEHAPMIANQFPKWTNRIRYRDICDVDETAPEIALPQIESEVDKLVQNLRSGLAYERNCDVLIEF